jgi:hypothetical protein
VTKFPIDTMRQICYKVYDAVRYKGQEFSGGDQMDLFKKAFLYIVGAVAVAYEEASKVVKEQQKRMTRTDGKVKTTATKA